MELVTIIEELTNIRLQIGSMKLREKELMARLEVRGEKAMSVALYRNELKPLNPVVKHKINGNTGKKRTPEQRERMRQGRLRFLANKRKEERNA